MIIIIRKSLLNFLGIIMTIFIIITLLPTLAYSPYKTFYSMPAILIDPGHGGKDGGTHDYNGFLEKNIVLDFSYLLKDKLESYNFLVYLTRYTDRDLSKFAPYQGTRQRTDLLGRVKMIKKYRADIMISIHVNAARDPNLSGTIIFYQKKFKESKKLASYISESIKILQTSNRNEYILPGNFYILNKSSIPTVLIELGFITNRLDLQNLKNPEYMQEMAESIAYSIYQYYMEKQNRPIFYFIF